MSVKKSPKIQKLVVNAIRKLQDVQGSTPQEISNYISQEYDVPNTKIQRQVRLALARAVSYGILQRSKGGYYTCNRELIGTKRPFEDLQPMDKCGCAPRRGRARAAAGGKSRRRKRGGGGGGGGSCKRPARRRKRAAYGGGGGGGGRKARRRSRRARSRGGGKGGGKGGCGGGGGRKARRRKAARSSKSRCGGGAPRRKKARRSRPAGKQCGTDGKRRGKIDQDFFSSASKRRRARSISNVRNENRSGSPSLSVSDEEHPDEKRSLNENIESPENLLD